jgi:hypothetical protein
MQQRTDVSRRRFLSRVGMVAVTYASSSFGALSMHDKNMRGMKKIAPNGASPGFNPDVDIELTCQPGEARMAVQVFFCKFREGDFSVVVIRLSG